MSKVKGRVSVYPMKKLTPSAVIDVEWQDSPKSERPKVAADAVLKVMRQVYPSQTLIADKNDLRDKGEAGRGLLNVDGVDLAYFTAVEIPEPVPAASLFGGWTLMSADQIYRANSRRMWRAWLPAIAVLVLALYFVLPLPNGLGLLTMLVFTATCFGAVVDWASTELRAHQAIRAAGY